MTVALEEVRHKLSAREVCRALGYMLVVLAFVLVSFAALVGLLVLIAMTAHGQVQLTEKAGVIGRAYDGKGLEFPVGVEGHCWLPHPAYSSTVPQPMYCFENGHWSWRKPVVIMAPKTTPMYECPYGQHYHPLAKDVVPADAEMWKHPDVQTQTTLPVLDGRCHSIDFDESLSDRGKKVEVKR